jgi:hypothetical protein
MSILKTRYIRFTRFLNFIRPLKDNERSVIETFKNYINRCRRCFNVLCARAHVYARNIINYIYLNAGRLYSLIDQRTDFRYI